MLLKYAIYPNSAIMYSNDYHQSCIVPTVVNFNNATYVDRMTLPDYLRIEIIRNICEQVSYLRDRHWQMCKLDKKI